MRTFLQVISVLWKIYSGIVLLLSLIVFYPAYLLLLNNQAWLKVGFKLIRFHSLLILTLIGVRPRIKFESELPKEAFIICPNHTSYLDILLLFRVFPDYFIFIGKRELETDRLFSIFFRKMNILVNRDSAIDGMRALSRAGEHLKSGVSVVIFPEGTIPDHAPDLMPFKNGPFKLAIKEEIPIVPVSFINVYKLLQIGAFLRRRGKPGIAHVTVNKAINTKGLKAGDFVDLRDSVAQVIERTIKQHYADRR
ncbi:MAG: lysophospholipid acyltransferase family protein [Vicingaceae bacterium]